MRNLHVISIAAASFMALGLLASTASAQEFGKSGQIAISSDMQFSFIYNSVSPAGGGDKSNTMYFTLQPALDYFVTDGLSIGGLVKFQYTKPKEGSTMDIGIGPRIGYAIPLGDKLAFWPKLGFTFDLASQSPAGGGDSVSGKKLNVGIFAPFVIMPADHFFLGIGPTFDIDVYSNGSSGGVSADGPKAMNVGIGSTVGGWF